VVGRVIRSLKMASSKMHGLLCLLLFLLHAQAWVLPRHPPDYNFLLRSRVGESDLVASSSPEAGLYEAITNSLADATFLKLTVSSNAAETVDSDATCVFDDPLYRCVYRLLESIQVLSHVLLTHEMSRVAYFVEL